MKRLGDVLISPIVTERSAALKEKNRFAFLVSRSASKKEIKDAVEKIFSKEKNKVTVLKVNTITLPGKKRRLGRFISEPKRFKKAIVTLKPGQDLGLFEGA